MKLEAAEAKALESKVPAGGSGASGGSGAEAAEAWSQGAGWQNRCILRKYKKICTITELTKS